MKRILSIALLAVAICATPLFNTGCSLLRKPTQQKQALNTITTVGETVKFTIDGYLDLVVKGTLSTNSVPVVMHAYGDFQNIYRQGLILVLGNTNAAPPQSVLDAAAIVVNTVTSAKRGGP